MSQHSEHISKAKKSSHNKLQHSTELEEGSTASEEDTFLSIWYPSPPFFQTPYLCNWDFQTSEWAVKYLTKHFNFEMIKDGLQHYPDLSKDPVYYSTFIDPDHFNNLQQYINKSIWDHNAHLQIWSEHIARYYIWQY